MKKTLADPVRSCRFLFEAKGIEQVCPQEAHGQPESLFRLWMAANVNLATLGTGAIATSLLGLPLWKAALALAAANCLGSLLLGLFSTYGVRYGLPMMALCAPWFGRWGNRVLSGINFLNGVSWFAVNTVVAAYALEHVVSIPPAPAIFLLAAVQILLAAAGHKLILRAGDVCFLVLVFLFSVVSALSLLPLPVGAAPPPKAALGGTVPGGWLLAGSLALSYLGGWMLFAPDYSRYLRYEREAASLERQVFRHTFWGAFLSTTWIEILGAFLGGTIRSENPTDLLFPLLPGSLHLLLAGAIVIGTISANMLNLYSAGLSLLGAGFGLPRYQASLLVGVAGLAVALLGRREFYQRYEGLLFLLAYLIFPRLPILVIAHLGPRVSRLARLDTGSIGFLCWLGGVLASLPWIRQEPWVLGALAATHPEWGDLAFPVGSAVSALLYVSLTRRERSEAAG
ncbi:cytosine permease [Methylacidimicrobium sp. AP8]|uniref:purine-cytosine permease family protein n=1 Tax=Methylacidimicrobium sp. AP8 TaxID=2730359 RepID=UPI00192398DD|nr:cytosine permease [Methylacidimicrobium sp. AP8]